jgi:prolyl-tRNA synthetase
MSRWSQAFIPTLKEVPAEAQVVSHVYMLRAGYMRKVAAGIYSFLPLGWRVLKKVEDIVREEMNRAGAQEILMPVSIPAELWQESGRWQAYGPELLRWKDRKQADFVLGPTHEEVVVDLVRREVKSYRQLPQNLYQVQTKFRDEARPRAGLMRGREFIMKDGYSFDVDDDAAKMSYQAMYDAYTRIFKRCGLEFRPVEADTGNIGGTLSHEFQVLAQSGEDKIVSCTKCDYAANVEQAEVRRGGPAPARVERALEKVHTPGKKGIDDVAAFLEIAPARMVKTLVFLADGKPVVALVRGDHDVNEIKVRKRLGAQEVVLASDTAIAEVTGAPVGFAGPRGLQVPVLADLEVEGMTDAVTGANEADQHFVGFDMARDAPAVAYADLRVATAGDPCPRCGVGVLERFNGIEVGHVFFLGTKYSTPMGCTFLGDDGALRPMVMGCYGIGITRTAAAAIEQNHDADGIIWPMALAPYQVELLTLQPKDPDVVAAAERLYAGLTAAGVEVLFDDRDERPGAKFKDADLIGVPLRLAVGKKSLAEGKVELKPRRAKAAELIPAGDAVAIVVARVREELR